MSIYEFGVIDAAVEDHLAGKGISQASGFAFKRLSRDMYRFVRGFGIWTLASSAEAADAAGLMMMEWKLTHSRWLSDAACYGVLRAAVAATKRLHPGLPLRQSSWERGHLGDAWCLCEACRHEAKAVLPELLLGEEDRDALTLSQRMDLGAHEQMRKMA